MAVKVATAIAGKAVKNFKESVDGIDIETSTIAEVEELRNKIQKMEIEKIGV